MEGVRQWIWSHKGRIVKHFFNALYLWDIVKEFEKGNPFDVLLPLNREQERHPAGLNNRDFGVGYVGKVYYKDRV